MTALVAHQAADEETGSAIVDSVDVAGDASELSAETQDVPAIAHAVRSKTCTILTAPRIYTPDQARTTAFVAARTLYGQDAHVGFENAVFHEKSNTWEVPVDALRLQKELSKHDADPFDEYKKRAVQVGSIMLHSNGDITATDREEVVRGIERVRGVPEAVMTPDQVTTFAYSWMQHAKSPSALRTQEPVLNNGVWEVPLVLNGVSAGMLEIEDSNTPMIISAPSRAELSVLSSRMVIEQQPRAEAA